MSQEKLPLLRNQIDQIDAQLLELMKKRFEIVGEVGKVKKGSALPTHQENRKQQVIEKWKNTASTLGLDPSFAEKLFEVIHSESVKIQDSK